MSKSQDLRPRQLPGLYWDEERQRYFPITSRRMGAPISNNVASSSKQPHAPNVQHSKNKTTKDKRTAINQNTLQLRQCMIEDLKTKPYSFGRISALRHRIMGVDNITHCNLRTKNLLYAPSTRSWMTSVPSISCFKFASRGNQRHLVVGNANGVLWWMREDQLGGPHSNSSSSNEDHDPWRVFEPPWYNADRARSNGLMVMMKDLIYRICASEDYCIATTFGSTLGLAVLSLQEDSDGEQTHSQCIPSYHFARVYDVHSAALSKRSAVLGTRDRLIHIPDVEQASQHSSRAMRTKSDVLSLYYNDYDVLAGLRNGSIFRFDMRASEPGYELFEGYFRQKSANSITWMEVVRDREVIVGTMSGDLEMFDLRYPRRGRSLMRFEGHVNSYHARLGIAIDPSADFLFAAGEDNRIRAWSLRTGERLTDSTEKTPVSTKGSTLSDLVLAEPSRCIQVTEGADGQGLRLWVATDTDIEGYGLGRMEPAAPLL